jgi:farnesyl diphosphate synthase
MVTSVTVEQEFQERLAAVTELTERTLDRLLSLRTLPGEIYRPPRYVEALRYATFGGGKRLRPFLMIETARLFGVENEGVVRAAAALEMIHCYSFVHDDLPAMDNDDLRRGRPTTHKAYDEATAILVGDGLLTYAFDVLADPATHPDPAIRAELVLALARSAGLGGMVGGQILDLEAEYATKPHTAEAVGKLQSMKTGALVLYAVHAGAVLGQADDAEKKALIRYGAALGAAYQVADDILDVEGDEAVVGKRVGKDAGRNKATLVAVLGLDGARERRDMQAREALAALEGVRADRRTTMLQELARFAVSRNH